MTERGLVEGGRRRREPLTTRIGAYVTHGAAVANVDGEASRVVRRMLNFGVLYLPVFDASKVVGMVSMRDLLALEAWPPGVPAKA